MRKYSLKVPGLMVGTDKPLSVSSFFFFFLSFCHFLGRAPLAYGSSQARGLIGAEATGLHQGHSNAGSEPHLQPTPQLTATPDR